MTLASNTNAQRLPSDDEPPLPDDLKAFTNMIASSLRLVGNAHARRVVDFAQQQMTTYADSDTIDDPAAEDMWLHLYDKLCTFATTSPLFSDLECSVRDIIALYDEGHIGTEAMPLFRSNLLFIAQLPVDR